MNFGLGVHIFFRQLNAVDPLHVLLFKLAIGKIGELRMLPSEKIKEWIEPKNGHFERVQKVLQIMKDRDMRSGSEN
jgi:hypothetical protein